MDRQEPGLLQSLLREVPEGFLVDSRWLTDRGFSRQLLHRYVQSGWLERAGHGLFRKPSVLAEEEDGLDWVVPVLSAQWMGYDVHVGGPTALELQGYAHYLRLGGKPVVYLYSASTPSWLKKLDLQSELRFRKPSLFSDDRLGVDTVDAGRFGGGLPVTPWSFDLTLSTPERAILEALDELPASEGFDAVNGVFQGLFRLRPNLLTDLLGDCRSVKVKRLFFVFADRHAHAWRKYLDPKDFDLGSGDRGLVKGGRIHPDYRIVVPRDFVPAAGEASSGA